MPRPMKCRRVGQLPEVTYFKPSGVPLRALDEVVLSIEEAEAIRLKDLVSLEQAQGAEKMNISRATFQRVLASARQNIADALLNGKAIRIEGGSFEVASRRFRCQNGHEWDVPFEAMVGKPPQLCPTCSTSSIGPLPRVQSGRGRRGRNQAGDRI